MARFVALFYGKWFLTQTLSPAEAPRTDIAAIEEMKMYQNYDKAVAEKCFKSMTNHDWYLHESLIPLSLVDPLVSDDEKRKIADKILDLEQSEEISLEYVKPDISDLVKSCQSSNLSLADFVKPGSKLIFNILKMDTSEKLEWLLLPPVNWHLMSPYKRFCEFVHNMPVVNDAAEKM